MSYLETISNLARIRPSWGENDFGDQNWKGRSKSAKESCRKTAIIQLHFYHPAGRTQIISKRGVGQMREEQPCCSKRYVQREKPQKEERTNEQKEAENIYMPIENEMPHENEVTEEEEITNQNKAINK